MNTSAAYWNREATPIWFFPDVAGSQNTVTVMTSSRMFWAGEYRSVPLGLSERSVTRFTIEMNEYRIDVMAAYLGTSREDAIVATFTHELAHVIGLEDQPSLAGPDWSIMWIGTGDQLRRNRRPQEFDVDSVRMLYGDR